MVTRLRTRRVRRIYGTEMAVTLPVALWVVTLVTGDTARLWKVRVTDYALALDLTQSACFAWCFCRPTRRAELRLLFASGGSCYRPDTAFPSHHRTATKRVGVSTEGATICDALPLLVRLNNHEATDCVVTSREDHPASSSDTSATVAARFSHETSSTGSVHSAIRCSRAFGNVETA